MDEKSLALELGDYRVMDFKVTGKTKFLKNGDEVKPAQFHGGDQISVEAQEDAQGYFTAVNVYWEKAAGQETASGDKDKKDGVVDTWGKDAPGGEVKPESSKAAERDPDDPDRPRLVRTKPAGSESKPTPADPSAVREPALRAEPAEAPAKEASAEVVRPAPRAADDPGPPKLTRGRPANPGRLKADPVPEDTAQAQPERVERASAEPVRQPSIRRSDDEDTPVAPRRPGDELIRRATDAALDFTETLPAYVCQEVMTRYMSETHPARFNALDVVTTNLVYENGREEYRDVTVNGKPRKSLEESGGAWSTGEFGSVLIDLFSPATATEFVYQHDSRIAGVMAKLYDFRVQRENSHWQIHMGSQMYAPAYKGSVWIDPQTARVLRIEMQGDRFPETFPIDHVESATDYQYTRLGDAKQYLLPVHAETLSCQRGTNVCSKNTIDFRNYHKYSGESTVTFGTPKQ
jgi:hypothetical protein